MVQHTDISPTSPYLSVTISAWKWCSIQLYLQLFVWGRMSYLRYICLFVHSGVRHILCCVFFVFCFFFRLVYHMLSVSVECQFFITPSVFSKVYWNTVLDEVHLCFPISEIVDKLDERYNLIRRYICYIL